MNSHHVVLGLTLETQRLILRPPAVEDFDAYAACMADERTARFIGGVQVRPTAWRSFAAMTGSWVLLGFGFFSVIEKASGQWIGFLGTIRPEGWPGTEVGYALIPDAWGKGYAVEGSVAVMDWAFSSLGWTDIIHTINPDNLASQAVARRLGATNRGPGQLPAPNEALQIDIWGQTRAEWELSRSHLKGGA